jgi:hypothetical protein
VSSGRGSPGVQPGPSRSSAPRRTRPAGPAGSRSLLGSRPLRSSRAPRSRDGASLASPRPPQHGFGTGVARSASGAGQRRPFGRGACALRAVWNGGQAASSSASASETAGARTGAGAAAAGAGAGAGVSARFCSAATRSRSAAERAAFARCISSEASCALAASNDRPLRLAAAKAATAVRRQATREALIYNSYALGRDLPRGTTRSQAPDRATVSVSRQVTGQGGRQGS